MRIDIQILLLFGVEDVVMERHLASRRDGDFGPLMNPDWRNAGFEDHLGVIIFF